MAELERKNKVSVLGNYASIVRQRSGLFSLDVALSQRGELGIPMRTLAEIYGYPNVGKSSLSYYLAFALTGKGNAYICDLENADPAYIKFTAEAAGLDGNVKLVDTIDEKGKPISHEDMLAEGLIGFKDDATKALIIDSIGAVTPAAEADGDLGDANMGKRAKLVNKVARAMAAIVRNKTQPSIAIAINHVHGVMGGRGHVTPGGETLKYMSAIRIMVWPTETMTKSEEDPTALGFRASGRVEKLRYGGKGREFTFYIVPGYGVHTGATAMFDCFELGLAERGATVKMDGKSYGYLKKDLLAYAAEGKQRKFDPFVEKLKEYEETLRFAPLAENDVVEVEEVKKGKKK